MNTILSIKNSKKYAAELVKTLNGGEVIALNGPLGSGKTTFTKHLAKCLKVKGVVTSPTFIIMSHKQGKTLESKKIIFLHLDLYRTNSWREVEALGLTELWQKPEVITIIEWADKIKKYLPSKTIYINFSENNEF